MTRRLRIAAAILLTAATAVAADRPLRPSVFDDYLETAAAPRSLLTIPGLSFHQSVGFSFVSADGLGSTGAGYYMGHFDWRLRDDLVLRWDVGVSSIMTGPVDGRQPEFILPNVDLTYRPSDRLTMRLQFRRYSSGARYFLR